ncbi:MAG: AMED_5909 family protein [Pseudonocardiaceae bacterium]
MTGDEATDPKPPRTLVDAQVALALIRPRRQAPLAEWLAYYQRSASWYAEIAEIDRGHHHEALYMAEQEGEHAKEIAAQIQAETSVRDEGCEKNHDSGGHEDLDAGS